MKRLKMPTAGTESARRRMRRICASVIVAAPFGVAGYHAGRQMGIGQVTKIRDELTALHRFESTFKDRTAKRNTEMMLKFCRQDHPFLREICKEGEDSIAIDTNKANEVYLRTVNDIPKYGAAGAVAGFIGFAVMLQVVKKFQLVKRIELLIRRIIRMRSGAEKRFGEANKQTDTDRKQAGLPEKEHNDIRDIVSKGPVSKGPVTATKEPETSASAKEKTKVLEKKLRPVCSQRCSLELASAMVHLGINKISEGITANELEIVLRQNRSQLEDELKKYGWTVAEILELINGQITKETSPKREDIPSQVKKLPGNCVPCLSKCSALQDDSGYSRPTYPDEDIKGPKSKQHDVETEELILLRNARKNPRGINRSIMH
jgi:hypothetical protein